MQPTNNILLPQTTANLIESNQPAKVPVPIVGPTWSNVGIDLENLMSGKSKSSGPSLSMNQLKLQSPTKTSAPSIPSLPQPSSLHINNNNNINSNHSNLFDGLMSPTLSTTQFANNIPNNHNNQQTQQNQLFGNLLSNSNSNNFSAFQWYIAAESS